MKEQCKAWVKQHLDEGMDLVKAMYEHPELGDQEFESMALLCEKLEQLGFAVERSYLMIPENRDRRLRFYANTTRCRRSATGAATT